jgi:Lrp/AsnC family leucine-responsive transcriptional regulator
MDSLDRKIIDILQCNNQLPAGAIAARVGLSPSAVQRRLQRLRDSGVIESDVSTVSPEAVGRHFLAIVGVAFETEFQRTRSQFADIVREMPEVMQCWFVTGETTDVILVVSTRDQNGYNALMSRLVEQLPIKRFTTNVVLERLKSGLAVPTDSMLL